MSSTKSDDKKFFDALNAVFIVPIFFYLAFVLFLLSFVVVLQSAMHPSELVLGAIVFVLACNAKRYGKQLMGE